MVLVLKCKACFGKALKGSILRSLFLVTAAKIGNIKISRALGPPKCPFPVVAGLWYPHLHIPIEIIPSDLFPGDVYMT